MIPMGIFSLPDSFVAGIVLVVGGLLFLAIVKNGQGPHGRNRLNRRRAAALFILPVICFAYASVTVVPHNKVGVLSTMEDSRSEILPQGLHFKLPWENVATYDDVIAVNITNSRGFAEPQVIDIVPMSRQISVKKDFVVSFLAEKRVDNSYLLANECINAFNNLIASGQSTLEEYLCARSDKSLLVIRELDR